VEIEAALNSPVLLFARDENGKKLVSGKDFYGFENSGREEEIGFKQFSSAQVSLCR
jgi:hypothetical protein